MKESPARRHGVQDGLEKSYADRFSRLLREELEAAGHPTYQSIANRGGISKSAVSDAMRGIRLPSARTVCGIMTGMDRPGDRMLAERDRLVRGLLASTRRKSASAVLESGMDESQQTAAASGATPPTRAIPAETTPASAQDPVSATHVVLPGVQQTMPPAPISASGVSKPSPARPLPDPGMRLSMRAADAPPAAVLVPTKGQSEPVPAPMEVPAAASRMRTGGSAALVSATIDLTPASTHAGAGSSSAARARLAASPATPADAPRPHAAVDASNAPAGPGLPVVATSSPAATVDAGSSPGLRRGRKGRTFLPALAATLAFGIGIGMISTWYAVASASPTTANTVAVKTGAGLAGSGCMDDGVRVADAVRSNGVRLEMWLSHECGAVWGVVSRGDGLDRGNTLDVVLYPQENQDATWTQRHSAQDAATAYTSILVIPEHRSKSICLAAILTRSGQGKQTADPLCVSLG